MAQYGQRLIHNVWLCNWNAWNLVVLEIGTGGKAWNLVVLEIGTSGNAWNWVVLEIGTGGRAWNLVVPVSICHTICSFHIIMWNEHTVWHIEIGGWK